MKRFAILTFFMVIRIFYTSAQNDQALFYYNEGLISMKNNRCREADSLFSISAFLLPHKDTYYNLALAKNCLNDHDGFCYYMTLVKEMGDTVAHSYIKRYCQDFDKMEYLKKINPESIKKSGNDSTKVLEVVEVQPVFPGGEAALMEFLGKNINYPPNAKDAGIQGTVFVQFIIETDGSVSEVKILRGIGGGCDEEAMRVVSKMPKWKPGYQRGLPVRVIFNLPIRFILQTGVNIEPPPLPNEGKKH